MSPKRKLRVFLCHASQDKPVVRDLYQKLLAEKWIDPWLDEENLLPGQDWNLEIEKAVEAADAVIVSLSNSSTTKEGYVQKEIRRVLDVADEKPDGTIFVVPLRLDNCQVPRRLKSLQYVDYFPTNQRDAYYQRILETLNARNQDINEKKKNPSIEGSFPTDTERKEKMKIHREYYEKGYSERSANEGGLSDVIQDLLAWAKMERKHKDYLTAGQLYKKAIAMAPHNILILREWADMAQESEDFLLARQLYERILRQK